MPAALRRHRIPAGWIQVDGGSLHVEGDIDPHRPGAAVERQVNGLFQVVADRCWIQDRHRVFRERPDDGNDIDFLNTELPHTERSAVRGEHAVGTLHLAGEKQHRSGIEPGAGHAGDGVGAARAGGHHGHAQVVGGLGVVLGGDGAGLLVRIADGLDVLALRQRSVEVHGAAAGHQEDVLDSLIGNEANDVIGELHHHALDSFTASSAVRRAAVHQFADRAVASAWLRSR